MENMGNVENELFDDDRTAEPVTPPPVAARKPVPVLAKEICGRIEAAGPKGIGGKRLAEDMHLASTRQLREVVAWARVKDHRHEIIGIPGAGYFWGPALSPAKIRQVINTARRMGRCWFYIGSLLKREGTAMAAVQMALDFAEHRPGEGADDLAALVASEGTTVADIMDAFMTELSRTEAGREALAAAGEKHADLLMPQKLQGELIALMERAKGLILGLPARKAG